MIRREKRLPRAVAARGAEHRENPRRNAKDFPARNNSIRNAASRLGENSALGRRRSPAVSMGVFLGVSFSGIGLTWLLLANRVPYLDHFASERNLALVIAFGVLGLVPTCRFMKSPRRNFVCGMTAWSILTGLYSLMELGFPRLATRLSAFHLFVLGCMLFGLLAALTWVVNLVILFRGMRPAST